jgi:hypothetical protein
MSGTLWAPSKVAAVSASLDTHRAAQRALTTLALPGATARVTLIVGMPDGSGETFSFDLVVAQALAFFQPVVDEIGAGLTAQGVDITQA